MAIQCAEIVTRATAYSGWNQGLSNDANEMLSRIRADQRGIVTSVSELTRDFFRATVSVSSTAASSGRIIALTGLPGNPVDRVLLLTLSGGRIANQVDLLDINAEYPPRYTARGYALIEVLSDWDPSSANPVAATLDYTYAPKDIVPNGDLTQSISVPDEWSELLVLPLALYLMEKDPSRDPAEWQRLTQLSAEKGTQFITFLKHYAGLTTTRFDIPSPGGQLATAGNPKV